MAHRLLPVLLGAALLARAFAQCKGTLNLNPDMCRDRSTCEALSIERQGTVTIDVCIENQSYETNHATQVDEPRDGQCVPNV